MLYTKVVVVFVESAFKQIPPSAKSMIERLAKRKTVEVSTLVRMWVIESMRREAALP